MKTFELIKFLKDKGKIASSDIDKFEISTQEIQELCVKFNWSIFQRDLSDGTYEIVFKDEDDNEITDFSSYDFVEEYIPISIQFACQEDIEKLKLVVPGMSETFIDPKVAEVIIDPGQIVYTHRKNSKKSNLHGKKTIDYFNDWREMPEFYYNFKLDCYAKITFKFNKKEYDIERLSVILDQMVTEKTDSLWYPKKEINDFNYYRVIGGDTDPKYPIYIVSKGRSWMHRTHTSFWLSAMRVHHYICVEPSDFENYSNCILNQSEYCHILQMDMEYKKLYNTLSDRLGNINSTGSGAARNFCADYSRKNGFHWCWILDDNVRGFYRIWRGRKIFSFTPEIFCSLERFVERYTNIGLAGLNYSMFLVNQDQRPPYVTNSKVYSFGLWNLDCPFVAQEGRYNEDVIQSLKILEQGWCTVQWNLYTGNKLRTQTCKGGNTEEIYGKEFGGTFSKTQMLVERFPQYAKLVWKFSRWHHVVDYTSFTQKLKIKPEYEYLYDYDYNKIDENGAYIVRIPKELHLTENDNRTYLEKMFPKGCPEDVTRSMNYCVDDRVNIELRNFWPDEEVKKCDKVFIRSTDILRSMAYGSKEAKIIDNPLFAEEEKTEEKNDEQKADDTHETPAENLNVEKLAIEINELKKMNSAFDINEL